MASLAAYQACFALPHPGGFAPLVLVFGLPAALLASCLRDEEILLWWLMASLPVALLLWQTAGGIESRGTVGLSLFAAFGAVGFALVRLRPVKGWLLLLSILVWLVAYFSSGHGSGAPMDDWWSRHGLSSAQAEALTLAFRKTVHLAFYGTVGWTGLRAARAAGAAPAEAVRTGMLTALAVASFDELRQSGYANRTGSAYDVLLDLAGAAAFVGLSEWRRLKAR